MVRDSRLYGSKLQYTSQSFTQQTSLSDPTKVIVKQTNPSDSLLFVASLFEDQPVLVDISGTVPVKRQLPSAPRRLVVEGEDINEKQAAQDAKQTTCVTIFNALGTHIISGTNKGWLNIIDVKDLVIRYSTRLCTGLVIFLRLSASGRDMVCNATDRVIRTIPIPDFAQDQGDVDDIKIEVEHKFQDVVNRLSWNHVTFSSTGDYVAATTYMNHDIYVWERGHGSLTKILEGPREELGVVEVCRSCTSIIQCAHMRTVASSPPFRCSWRTGDRVCLSLVNYHSATLVSPGPRLC